MNTQPTPGGIFALATRTIPRIGYGMGQLARRADSADGEAAAVNLLRLAFDLGVRHFDTAQFYENGRANDLLRRAFGDRRDDVVLVSKAGADPSSQGPPMKAAQKPADLRASIENNLRSLGTDHLDVVYLRRMDSLPGLLATGDQVVPLEDQLAELVSLRDAGTIGGIGLSHISLEQLQAALDAKPALVSNIYNMLDRTWENMLSLCREQGIGWAPFFPLGGGGSFFNLPKVAEDPIVVQTAQRLVATPTQVGMAWLLHHSPNTLLITGTSSPDHLRENVAAGDLALDEETLSALDQPR